MDDALQNDRLEIAWRKLGAELQAREKRLELDLKEVEALREQFAVLDRARVLVLQATTAGEAAVIRKAVEAEKSTRSLKRDTLHCVLSARVPEGVSAATVTEMLQDFLNYKPESKQSLYSSVYVTLKRLAKEGRLVAKQGEKGRIFAAPEKTEPLFQ